MRCVVPIFHHSSWLHSSEIEWPKKSLFSKSGGVAKFQGAQYNTTTLVSLARQINNYSCQGESCASSSCCLFIGERFMGRISLRLLRNEV